MFYLSILSNVINYKFPENFINYDYPYFRTCNEMEEFLSLARSFDPEFLYQNNVIIYYNNKKNYKYYKFNKDQNGVPYEFKVVKISESTNPIYNENYKNNFNISNIDKKAKNFDLKILNNVEYPHSDDSYDDTIEDNYYCEDELSDEQVFDGNINYIHEYYNERNVQKYSSSFAYINQMLSNDELDYYSDENDTDFCLKNVEIINKLVVTNDWINYIYNEPMKLLMKDMKSVVKRKDVIRTKSISLPRNVYFYLVVFFLALQICCSAVLFSWTSTLKKDRQFLLYGGINLTEVNDTDSHKMNSYYKQKTEIINDEDIVPDKTKYKKIHKGCSLCSSSAIFGIIFFIFVIYMCIRVAREKKKKYQDKKKKKKVGLNLCHIVVLILLTLVSFVVTFVAEIFIIIAIVQNTYLFLKVYMRAQLIMNSFILISYVMIILFYFRI